MTMGIRHAALPVLWALLLTPACTNKQPSTTLGQSLSADDLVAAHTSGYISVESSIRVRFVEPVGSEAHVNEPLARSPFSFRPRLEGVAVWTSDRELEFRPRDRLPSGQTYAVTLELADFVEGGNQDRVFGFEFSTMEQSFEVNVDGLEAPDPADASSQLLTGSLLTADAAAGADVEEVLHAAQEGRPLDIAWTHSDDRRTHPFVIEGITRRSGKSEVVLQFNGRPIGVDRRGESTHPVASLDTFEVAHGRAVQGTQRYIEIRFTDPLLAGQDLNGLIRVEGRQDLRFEIHGSITRVYTTGTWSQNETVHVETGVRNSRGDRLAATRQLEVAFEALKPQVRFADSGVILPTTQGLTIPIETVNLQSIVVEAMHVRDQSIPQFLQVNNLDGDHELRRVGRVVWKQTVPLHIGADKANRWVRSGLDLQPLIANNPGGMYRLRINFRRNHIHYECADTPELWGGLADEMLAAADEEQESSSWDWWENQAGLSWWELSQNRHDPCHPGYYKEFYNHNITVTRTVLVSDIGVIAKAGEDKSLLVVATDLKTVQPLRGASVRVLDYQQQELTRARTNADGMVRLNPERKPYLAVVDHADHRGYVKLDDGSALSMAHFDVSGAEVSEGLKGLIYGERGVWRPGDTIYLTFVLFDRERRLPDNHPVRFTLINSRGQIAHTVTRTSSVNGFYSFEVSTAADAPTGDYVARVNVGGAVFDKTVKVETVMPNRLKIDLDFQTDLIRAPDPRVEATLSSSWLHGAIAKNLRADVELSLRSRPTSFPRFSEHVFDDPTRRYSPQSQTVFESTLDDRGSAPISSRVDPAGAAPGMLSAVFRTRVFEPGGAFSSDRFSIPLSPYERYVGIRTPPGDTARGMLLTDVDHPVDVVAVDQDGELAGDGEVTLKLYKIHWRWWWETGDDSLPDYAGSTEFQPLQSGTVTLEDGRASWSFKIEYPSWGRYLIVAEDSGSGHRSGKIVYVDWPGWAGRSQKDAPGGAAVLAFAADSNEVAVGDQVAITIPTALHGRGLVSIESGSRVVDAAWIEPTGAETRYTFTATPDMAPNVFVHVAFLQPHLQTENDLPIRLYGVIPIKVNDPETRLEPSIRCAEVFEPEGRADIEVSEASGSAMTYTLAVVDEGLLGLTRFKTPDPWRHFYRREALGVKTWDYYDLVAGAHGAALERMLTIGGDGAGELEAPQERANRFPPMVRFLGPFELARGAVDRHDIDIPLYVGAVRVMVVAGQDNAFGATDTSVFVRKPLMVLGTLPRVLGPGEEVEMPVSVFAMDKSVRDVEVRIAVDGPIESVGPAQQQLGFSEPGDALVFFRLRTSDSLGVASVRIDARAGSESIGQQIELDVRMPGMRVVDTVGSALEPNQQWQHTATLPGLAGTNTAILEVSRVPPLDLGNRLRYLIRYPHGCVEQTTSAVYPQLYLTTLLDLPSGTQSEIETNIRAGIQRLTSFQTSNGGFSYWPTASGGFSPGTPQPDDWSSSYTGHFLVEAERAGYPVPAGIIEQWKSYQRQRARSWVTGPARSELIQSYRLYTLALAGSPELGAMNRLREAPTLPVAARWRLAAAYHLAGQPESAHELVKGGDVSILPYRELAVTYGSDVRDKAMVLEALVLMDMHARAGTLAKEISAALSSGKWHSTQTTAFALVAMSRFAGVAKADQPLEFSYSWGGRDLGELSSVKPLIERELDVFDVSPPTIEVTNLSPFMVYPRLILSGLPEPGSEQPAANGMRLDVVYMATNGEPIDPARLEQGTDVKVQITVENTGDRGDYDQVALSHIVPSGWEIHNQRLDPAGAGTAAEIDYQDVRDDRIYTYFDLEYGESKTFTALFNASYVGSYYLPLVAVEAMYDATINARVVGQRVEVARPGADSSQ